ncbi:hypothetical protein B296_00049475 [Ensete ventricosum]|uniref:Uncharacterized protein n=1 Tax=Ensete ventricosum TaxID=4639 RepID=A0A426X0U5_ENSVE|nr:hypothetical protein B296_00049475 [Ensete ventricosum]
MADWDGASESDLKAAGVEPLPDGRRGLRLKGWHIESIKRPILGSLARQENTENLDKTTQSLEQNTVKDELGL